MAGMNMHALSSVDENFSGCGRTGHGDFSAIAASGFRSVICNRPDGESSDQFRSPKIETAARLQGIRAANLPVVAARIDAADVSAFANLRGKPPAPAVVFWRSGTRSSSLYACRLTVEIRKIIVAEFRYGEKLLRTFPLEPPIARRSAWILEKIYCRRFIGVPF